MSRIGSGNEPHARNRPIPANPDLLRGTLEPVVLELIAGGASYGYEIARAVERASGGQLLAQEGTLYPALHRLEKRGSLPPGWERSPQRRRRETYSVARPAPPAPPNPPPSPPNRTSPPKSPTTSPRPSPTSSAKPTPPPKPPRSPAL